MERQKIKMNQQKQVYFFVGLTAFLFGTMEVSLKVAGGGMDAFQLTFLRFFIGGIILLPFALVELKKSAMKLNVRDILWLLATGIMGIPISMLFFQLGVMHSNASTASVIICINPLITMVIAHYFMGEFMNRMKVVSMAVALVGILFMIRPWDMQPGNTPRGAIEMLIAAVTFSVYTVMGKRSTQKIGVMAQTSFSFIMGSLVLLAVILIMGRPVMAGVASHILLVLYIGVFVTGVGYWSYFEAIKKSDASTGSIAFLIKPAIAPVLAILILHESLVWSMVVGIVLVLTGSILNLRENRNAAGAEDAGSENEAGTGSLSADKVIEILASHRPGAVGRFKGFSVLIPMVETERGTELLFEVRAEDLDRQPGEICFPGGEMDGAETPLMCAVRETKEELSIRRSDMGQVQKVHTLYGSSFFISCFAAPCSTEHMKISESEVAETFTVPLSFFMENEPEIIFMENGPLHPEEFPYEKIGLEKEKGYDWRIEEHEVPVYHYEGRVIWGITARLIHGFTDILKGRE